MKSGNSKKAIERFKKYIYTDPVKMKKAEGTTIRILSKDAGILANYCEHSPAKFNLMVDRILRGWWCGVNYKYLQNVENLKILKKQMDSLEGKIKNSNLESVDINKENAKIFRRRCEYLNINPDHLAAFLVNVWMRENRIGEMVKIKRERHTPKFETG